MTALANQARIPRILHQIWYQGEAQMPDKFRRFSEGWRANHPDWTFHLWNETTMRDFIAGNYAWFLPVYDGYPFNIQRIDAVRYFILDSMGGLYVDADIESLKPVDTLLEGCSLLVSRTLGYNNAVVGSAPGHALWPVIFDALKANHARPARALFDFLIDADALFVATSTGPRLFTESVRKSGVENDPDTRVCPYWYFEPGTPAEIDGRITVDADTSRSYGIHHMSQTWVSPWRRGIDAAARPLMALARRFAAPR
jgi:inositol phosphorylceramide mannosyltransferase catalytic subunit